MQKVHRLNFYELEKKKKKKKKGPLNIKWTFKFKKKNAFSYGA